MLERPAGNDPELEDTFLTDLKHEEGDLYQQVENADEAICFHDENGVLVFINKRAEVLLGYSRKDLANQNITTILDVENYHEIVRKALTTEKQECLLDLKANLITKSGENITVDILVQALKQNQKKVGIQLTVKDVKDRYNSGQPTFSDVQKLNLEIQKKYMKLEESSRIQSEFVSNISHEFRTPLNGIIGYSELLEDKVYGDLNGNQMAALQNIKACAADLLKMVQEILDLSRLKTYQLKLEFEVRSPEEIIYSAARAISPIAVAKGLKVETLISGQLPDIRMDFKRIYQVILNLANNAIKFTHEGSIQLGASLEGKHVKFFVKDTGIGISDELQELILHDVQNTDRRVNRFYGGMGLALSLSRRLVALHQGHFWVESQPGKGSKFLLTIPLKPQPVTRF